jgi:hypothetical protein
VRAIRNGLIVVAVSALLAAGCGGSEATSDAATGTTDSIACSANIHDVSFPARYLDGPELTRNELVETPPGQVLEALFVGGDAELEGGQYRESGGFSIVSDKLVLGYKDGVVTWFFALNEDGQVRSWGGCNPNHVRQNQTASRWAPIGHVPPEAMTIPIHVEGGACSTDNGREIVTIIEGIEVEERIDRVDVTVWTSERSLGLEFCAGVGLMIEADFTLAEPLGDRTLVDAGIVPPIRHPNPHQIEGTRVTYSCGSDLMQASVADYGSDAGGVATPEEALVGFPLTADDSFEHFLLDDTGDDTVYGFSDASGNFVATVTLLNLNDSWVIGATEQCAEMP